MITVQLDRDYEPEDFLRNLLMPALAKSEKVEIHIHSDVLIGRSWLDRVFGKLVHEGYLSLQKFKESVFLRTEISTYKTSMISSVTQAASLRGKGLPMNQGEWGGISSLLAGKCELIRTPITHKIVLVYEKGRNERQMNLVVELSMFGDRLHEVFQNGAIKLPYFRTSQQALILLGGDLSLVNLPIESYNIFSCEDHELEEQISEITEKNVQILRGLSRGTELTIYDITSR